MCEHPSLNITGIYQAKNDDCDLTLINKKGSRRGFTHKPAIEQMTQDVAENGGEYSFKTTKGQVQEVHRTELSQEKKPLCEKTRQGEGV